MAKKKDVKERKQKRTYEKPQVSDEEVFDRQTVQSCGKVECGLMSLAS